MVCRIVVKGASGSGKSTLGAALAKHLQVAFVELDALHHGPGWAAASAAELRERVSFVLDDSRGWVVDGNYDDKLGTLVTQRADLIVWLDLPLHTKVARLCARTARRWVLKEKLWNGNRETLKGVFWGREALIPWAVASHFRHRRRWPTTFAAAPLLRLRTAQDANAWFQEFCKPPSPR